MPNIITQIDIESAYTQSQKNIQILMDSRDERTRIWETEINEYICRIKRSLSISGLDGGQACGENDSGNSSITVYGSSYY